MFIVYIIYSKTIERFYIGQTCDVENRILEHNHGIHKSSFTRQANDWTLFFSINCISRKQALSIENHIKKMKSKIYLENLKKYPDIIENLKWKYK